MQTGNGLAMRAGIVTEALAEDFDVHVLLIPILGAAPGKPLPIRFRLEVLNLQGAEDPAYARLSSLPQPARTAMSALYPRPALCRFAGEAALARAAEAFAGVRFDVVHVFRLYTAPFAEHFLNLPPKERPLCGLDMDDLESSTHSHMAKSYESMGNPNAASFERAEALKYAHMESEYLLRFDRVFASSLTDVRADTALLPNAIRIPEVIEERKPSETFTFLFVGTMGYYPNEDAALYFCGEILPILERISASPFRVIFAGASPSPRVAALAENPRITVTGSVPDLSPFYRDASSVIVPLRAGGGTRIKVLEAFAHSRPVISTSAGAEGLAVLDGEHLLLADNPEMFAEKCRVLMNDERLRIQLAGSSFQWVAQHHVVGSVREILRHHYARLPN
jgi:glycosyltransferase involved in cell wall biosynthesis